MTIVELKEHDKASFADVSKKPVPKPQPTKEELRRRHLAKREKQWLEAYDNRRDNWVEEMKKAGVDDRVAGELADLYTPEMAKLGKPPKVVIENRTQAYNSSENKLILKPNMSLNDIRVLRHEMTHWWHYGIIKKHPEIQSELAKAAAADLKTIKKTYSKKRSDFMVSNEVAKDKVAKKMFRVAGGWDSLTEKEKKEAYKFFDSVGSISSGELGGCMAIHGIQSMTTGKIEIIF